MSTMVEDERTDGAVIIDLGANITSFGVFGITKLFSQTQYQLEDFILQVI